MAADRRSCTVMVLVVLTTLSCSALPRHRRQTGQYPHDSGEQFGSGFSQGPTIAAPCGPGEVGFVNCTHYYECSVGGLRTPIRCAAGTVASPNGVDIFTICTWPDEVPQCQSGQQGGEDIDRRLQNACNQPPSPDIIPGQAYHVPHPLYCNSYLTCGRGQVFLACVVCAQGTIFFQETGRCLPGGQSDCGDRVYVAHELVTNTTMYDETCRMPGGPGDAQFQGPLPQGQFTPQGQGQFGQEQGQGPFGQQPFVPPTQTGPFNPPGRNNNNNNPLNPYGGQTQGQGQVHFTNQQQNPTRGPVRPLNQSWYYRRY